MTSTSRLGLVLVGLWVALPIDNAEAQKMTLDEAISVAARNNERIGLARETVTGAEIQVSATWNRIKPAISLVGTAALQNVVDSPSGDPIQQRVQYQGSAVFAQPVFRRGLYASRDANAHGLVAAGAQLEFDCASLARDVAVAYINVVRARSLLANAQAASKRAEAQYTYAANRVKAGSALKTVELLAQIDVKRSERQRVSAEREAGRSEATFLRLVGIVPPELELPEAPTIPTVQAAREGALDRFDVVALRERIVQTQAETEAARGRRFWPLLDIQAGVDTFVPKLGEQSLSWRVMGVVTIPIFQSGQEFTDIAIRKNQARIADLQLALQNRTVVEQIETGAVDLETATEASQLASEQRDAAREHYSLVDRQFRLSAVTFLDVTNAQAALVEAENAYEIARLDRVRALYDFLFASGRMDTGACTGGRAARRAKKPPATTAQPPNPTSDAATPPPANVPDI
jgi:outer membrane protein